MICFKIEKQVLLIIYLLWLRWCINTGIHVKADIDSLKPGDSLNTTSMLCSKQGTYCMYFVESHNSKNLTYLKMFSQQKDHWLVWVANRDQPVDIDSAVLLLDNSGVLKIESQYRKPIILYSSPEPVNNNIIATLLDTGNFVVQQIQPNGMKNTNFLWQSFDYPTDSLLPGMKLGVNHKTGHKLSLVSMLTKTIPTSGPFKLEWEPSNRQLVINHREQVYWKSNEMENNSIEYKIVSNEDEDYFTLTPSNDNLTVWTLLETGRLLNFGKNDIARADLCYGYETDDGCQKWGEIPNCRNGGDRFEYKSGYLNYKILNEIRNSSFDSWYNINDCQAICWSNCSCFGFQYTNLDDEAGCTFIVSIEGLSIASGGDDIFYILVKNTTTLQKEPGGSKEKVASHGKNKWIWISAIIAATLLITCLPILFIAIIKKQKYMLKDKKRKRVVSEKQDLPATDESYGIKDLEDDLNGHDIKVFDYTSVLEATMNFSPEYKLGQGGYGPVYKGILSTGQEVAIKRLSKTSTQGIMEFKNELKLICELQHKNLVQLLGCCIHKEERILIYEYMPNKSLDFYLFDCTRRKCLDWKKRFCIIEGISQALLYLHKYSRLKIIHRDLKASNILLDENMNPKISDFGMARMFAQHESIVNTNRIVGTYGYMSPEYAMEGICSTKSDVYSFGVLLLEIICGRRNNSFYDDERPLNLVGHAWELWNEGEYLKLMDPSLSDTFIHDEVQRCIHVGLLCVEQYANDRPTMSDVISMLTNKSTDFILPRRPAFYFRRDSLEGETSSKVPSTYSTNETLTSSERESR